MTAEHLSVDQQTVIEDAKRIVHGSSDPFSGVINFLHQRPENEALEGSVMNQALLEIFGSQENIPQIIKAIAAQVTRIVRQANVIKISNEGPTKEKLGDIMIKKENEMKFEVALEKGILVLKNIRGLLGVEHGLEVPLERIEVKPPKLVVTIDMGFIHPQKTLDII